MMPRSASLPTHARPGLDTCAVLRLLLASVIALAACTSNERRGHRRPPARRRNAHHSDARATPTIVFPPFVNELIGRLVQDMVFDRLAEIDTMLTTIGDKSFTPRLATKLDVGARLAVDRVLDRSARALARRKAGHCASDVRYSFNVFTDPEGRVASRAAARRTSTRCRFATRSTAVVWFKRRTPEQFYDVAYQLVIIPEHVYGAIPLEQLHTSES